MNTSKMETIVCYLVCGRNMEDDEDFEEETPPEPKEMDSLPRPVKGLLALLD